jgi:hypothetical protein
VVGNETVVCEISRNDAAPPPNTEYISISVAGINKYIHEPNNLMRPSTTNKYLRAAFGFDIKRSGDMSQIVRCDTLNKHEKIGKCYKHVFVTADKIAFLNARIKNIPCILLPSQTQTPSYAFLFNPTIKQTVAKVKPITKHHRMKKKYNRNSNLVIVFQKKFMTF